MAKEEKILGEFSAEEVIIITPPNKGGYNPTQPTREDEDPEDEPNEQPFRDPQDEPPPSQGGESPNSNEEPEGNEGNDEDEESEEGSEDGEGDIDKQIEEAEKEIEDIDQIIEDLKSAGVSDNPSEIESKGEHEIGEVGAVEPKSKKEGEEKGGEEKTGEESESKKEGEGEKNKSLTPKQQAKMEILKNKKLEISIKKKIYSLTNSASKNDVLTKSEISEIQSYIKELETLI